MRPRPGARAAAASGFGCADMKFLLKPCEWGGSLDCEIGGDAACAIYTGAARALAKVFNSDGVQPRHDFLLQRLYQRSDDKVGEVRAWIDCFVVIFGAFGDANDLAYRNPASLLCEPVAAA